LHGPESGQSGQSQRHSSRSRSVYPKNLFPNGNFIEFIFSSTQMDRWAARYHPRYYV
jgi:hypothetical protein